MKVPEQYRSIIVYLEKIVNNVSLKEKHGKYPSFHPKTMFIRYVSLDDEKNVKYRLLVMSRNLTHDNSLEISYSMDGMLCNNKYDKNISLVNFLSYLNTLKKTSNNDKIIKEIANVNFEIEDTELFCDYKFVPFYDGIKNNNEEFNSSITDCFIMSPFISDSIIKSFYCKLYSSKGFTLITRKSELYKITDNNIFENTYVFKDEALIEVEDSQSESDIHAKIYILKKGKNECWMYVGSLNASISAFNDNVEMVIGLKSKNGSLSSHVNYALGIVDNDNQKNIAPDSCFEKATKDMICKEDSENEELEKELTRTLKEFVRCNLKGKVINNDGKYSIFVTSDYQLKNDICISVRLLSLNDEKYILLNKKQEHFCFEFNELEEKDLTPFIVIKLSKNDTNIIKLFKLNLEGLPENREDMVAKLIIDSKQKFIDYLSYMLAPESSSDSLLEYNERNLSSEEDIIKHACEEGLFEKLVKSFSKDRSSLERINDLRKVIDQDKVPDELTKLLEMFENIR